MKKKEQPSMYQEDTGYFVYDDQFPPLCVRERKQTNKENLDTDIIEYLQESYKEGLKHEDAILKSGLSAGEAGVIYLRKLNNKRRRVNSTDVNVDTLKMHVAESLRRHMDVDVFSPDLVDAFNKYVTADVLQTNVHRRKLVHALKLFLREINLKTKGYTAKLRNVMTTIHSQLDYVQGKRSKT
jgi:hypothetical protein